MPTRVILIALDAADADLIKGWAASGYLPTFKRLGETALRGTVENPFGLYVGALWPSFATGVSPTRHGRYCFTQLVPGTYPDPGDELRGDPGNGLLGLAGPGGAARRHHRRAEGVRHVRRPRQRPDPRLGQSRGRGGRRLPDEPVVARAERPRAVSGPILWAVATSSMDSPRNTRGCGIGFARASPSRRG